MRQILLASLLASLTLLSSKCSEDDCEVVPGGKKYNAWVPVKYSPMQERFKVGDTITVEILVPNQVKDTLSDELLQIKNIEFEDVWGGNVGGVVVRFVKTQDDSTKWIYAGKEFDYIQNKGKVLVSAGNLSAMAITLLPEEDKRTTIFQMIPQRSGIYNLGFATPYIDVTNQVGHYCAAELQLYFGGPIAHNYHLLKDFDTKNTGTYEQNRGTFSFIVEE